MSQSNGGWWYKEVGSQIRRLRVGPKFLFSSRTRRDQVPIEEKDGGPFLTVSPDCKSYESTVTPVS